MRVNLYSLGSVAGHILTLPQTAFVEAHEVKNPTFSKDIAPIFQEKWQNCHRKDSIAPMSLIAYEETRPWAKSLSKRAGVCQSRLRFGHTGDHS